jgi:multisubunit Na+/H+ antiporter MnhB subunit
MCKIFLRVFFFVSFTILSVLVFAQDSLTKEKPQMADLMRSNGKIYVVVVVLVIILTGLFIYLIQVDRKLSRMEKNTE